MADTADVEDYVYAFLDDNYPDVAKEMAAKVKRKLTAPTAPEDNLESVLEFYKKQCSQSQCWHCGNSQFRRLRHQEGISLLISKERSMKTPH